MVPESMEKFRFNKSAHLSEAEKKATERWLADLYLESDVIKSREIDSIEYALKIDYLICSGTDWAKEKLGIDLKLRIPSLKKIRFIYERDTPEEDRDPNVSAIHEAKSGSIYIIESSDEARTMNTLSHEIVHAFSNTTLQIERQEFGVGIEVSHSGFRGATNDTFKYFNELVTEAINIIILEYHRKQQNGIDYLEPGHGIGYANGVLFFDTLVKAAAEKLGEKEDDIRSEIFRGYFRGDFTVLKVFTRAFGSVSGEPILKTLSMLKEDYYPSELLHILLVALKIESSILPSESDYLKKWEKYKSGKPIEILGGITIHKNK